MYSLKQRNGIALLLTLFFIMAITVAVGVGLKQVKEASWEIEKEHFVLQTKSIVDDMLAMLKNSQELDEIDSAHALYLFLRQNSVAMFEKEGIRIVLNMKSARSACNINALVDANATFNPQRVASLREFFQKRSLDDSLIDIFLDLMTGKREEDVYRSGIFEENEELYRDYIVSSAHMQEALDFYASRYNNPSMKEVDFSHLFSYGPNSNYVIDLNYASSDVWSLLLLSDEVRARELANHATLYTKIEELELSEQEMQNLAVFQTSFFEPIVSVVMEISQNRNRAKLSFEYDIKTKKGTNFVYEI